MFIVCVTFTVNAGKLPEFLPLMSAQARNSVALEPGCHQFDVCHGSADPDVVFLYEVYADEAGFQHHLDSAHFKTFDAAVAPLVAAKEVKTFAALLRG